MPSGVSTGTGSGRVAVPLSVAWLDSLSLELSAATPRIHGRAVRYVMTALHRPSGTTWAVTRPFDAYRELRRTLRSALQRGHSCSAQCPWLFTFVSSYFPKPSLFRSSSSDRVVRARCSALAVYVETLRSALLARDNHKCGVLTGAVADAFTAFVCGGESRDRLPLKQWAFAGVQRLSQAVESSVALLEDAGGDCECALLASSRSRGPLPADRTLAGTLDADEEDEDGAGGRSAGAAAVCRVCDGEMVSEFYTVTLACGHEFHDECAVQRLNQRMSCPTCGQAVVDAA